MNYVRVSGMYGALLVCWKEHGDLGRGLKGRGEAGRGAEKNVELNKNKKKTTKEEKYI